VDPSDLEFRNLMFLGLPKIDDSPAALPATPAREWRTIIAEVMIRYHLYLPSSRPSNLSILN
jgi:hypothetical protein